MPSSSGLVSIRICWLIAIALNHIVATALLSAEPPTTWTSLSRPSSFAAWGEEHHGWKIIGDVSLNSDSSKRFDERQGRGVLVSNGEGSNLVSREEYQNVDVKLEFTIPKESNAGVKLMGRYEIQILDTHDAKELTGDSCGGIYPRAEQEPSYHYLDQGVPPRVNAAKPAGEWQSLEIEFIAPRFDAAGKKTSNAKFARVVLNGKLIHENVEVSAPTGAAWRLVSEVPRGPLLLQGDHGPVAFRNIRVRPRFVSAVAANDITIERLFGPEVPGRYKHPPSITELDNGDLYVVYYGGDGEYEGDTAVYGSRLAKGSKPWTRPSIIADTPDRSEGNAAVWQAPDGVVWLFYVTNYGPTWSSSRIKYKLSKDRAQTWTDSDVLAFELGSMVRGRPILLNNGDYLLPAYHETGEDRDRTAVDTCSYFLRYNLKTKTWTESNRIVSSNGNLQPAPAQITDDYLVAYCRPGGDFEPNPKRFVMRSESRDGGRTWSQGENSQFPNPNSAVDFIKLQNGHLLLVYNATNTGDRMPLTVAVSTDNDKSYSHRRNIVNKPGDTAAYPVAIQTRDGKIHIVYTSEERQVVNHAVFEESAILGHKQE